MAKQVINIGTIANDNTGDLHRVAFDKCNDNFTELYDGKQALDSDLTAIAALAPSNDDFLQRKSGAWVNRTVAQAATDLTTLLNSVYAALAHSQGLSTITQSGATTDQLTTWNGSAWIPTSGLKVDPTNGGIIVCQDKTESARVWGAQTTDMDFPIEELVSFSDFGAGQVDNSWSINLNRNGVSAIHPEWSENIENFYVTGGGLRLVEKNWSYTSIDGNTSYRPFQFNVDIDTHRATMEWHIDTFIIENRLQGGGIYEEQVKIDTRNGLTQILSPLGVGAVARNLASPGPGTQDGPWLLVSGTMGTASEFVQLTPTTVPAEATIVNVTVPTAAAACNGIKFEGSRTKLSIVLNNTRALGDAELFVRSTTGDAYSTIEANNQIWYVGADATNGSYAISPTFGVGSNNALTINPSTKLITTGGALTITGVVLAQPPAMSEGDAAWWVQIPTAASYVKGYDISGSRTGGIVTQVNNSGGLIQEYRKSTAADVTYDSDTGTHRYAHGIDHSSGQWKVSSGADLGTNDAIAVDGSNTATHTRFFLWDVDKNALQRVLVGAADSGGTGYKMLRVAN